MRRLVILLAAGALVLGACMSDSDSGSDTTAASDSGGDVTEATTASGEANPDLSDLPTYESVADIGADLGCQLEYDGIVDAEREYSTCVFEGEQALIYIYTDPTVVGDIANAGAPALAYGANWTIEVVTQPVAEAAAAATGGAVADAG